MSAGLGVIGTRENAWRSWESLSVAVIEGGSSVERAASHKSATDVARALDLLGHRSAVVELNADLPRAVRDGTYDVAFPVAHGGAGENGTLQATLEALGVPFVGSGSRASALAMHKPTTKVVFTYSGIPTPDGFAVREGEAEAAAAHALTTLGEDVIVKPAASGSSDGVTRIGPGAGAGALVQALKAALRGHREALVERYHPGIQVVCSVLELPSADRRAQPFALPPVEICSEGNGAPFVRHQAGPVTFRCPADCARDTSAAIQSYAIKAHVALGCRHYSRTDFLLSPSGYITVLETNTSPSMYRGSLMARAAEAAGLAYDELCKSLVLASMVRLMSHKERRDDCCFYGR